ncbi:MAG: class III extradiol ring-cleavage dioxygenase [Burkholderiales bacterium]|nr:class III extradiol ring-cleavage dioxygenase [Burkholderiales bacterium]
MTETTGAARMSVYFLSHGGGPWPWVDGMKQMFAKTAREFAALPSRLPAKPKAVLIITGHWEAARFSVSTSERPPIDYDYFGFPEHTYRLQYPAPGSPALAGQIQQLLAKAGFECAGDAGRGFDHGTFVPLSLMYPDADVPIVLLSLRSDYSAVDHIRVGEAISSLRDDGVLIMGSGLTYHSMRGFGRSASTPVAEAFEAYLNAAIGQPDAAKRSDMLVQWEQAQGARLAHPQEDHLLPLMVVAGAAGQDVSHRVFVDHAMSVAMASYQFGESRVSASA